MRAAVAIMGSLDAAWVLERVGVEAAAVFEADRVCVYRGGAVEGTVLEAAHNVPEDVLTRCAAAGPDLLRRAVESGGPLVAGEPGGEVQPLGGAPGGMAVALRRDDEAPGLLWLGFRAPRPVDDRELDLLAQFGDVVAVALSNAQAHARLALAARTDALTGCLNHAALHETLRREIRRCERGRHELSLVLLDLDDFKRINDAHGHLVGDEVLRRVGQALRQAVRAEDLVARYGGDEFAIVALDAGEGEAGEVARRAVDGLSEIMRGLPGGGSGADATAGVAQWEPARTAAELVEQADRALLWGKRAGRRGEVVFASGLGPGDGPVAGPLSSQAPLG